MKTIKIFAYALAVTSGVVLTSCGSDDNGGGGGLPPIGGFDSADEVGEADLMAYWPLNGDSKESVSGVSANANPNATWAEGKKGQAASFNGGYLSYPVIPSLTQMTGSFTVSLWAKVANNGTNATMFFSMTRPMNATQNEWNGPINVMAETGKGNRPITADTLQVKGVFAFSKPDGAIFGGDAVNAEKLNEQDILDGGQVYVNKTANQWMQVVYVYDHTNSSNRLYVNGTKISNPQWELRNKENNNAPIPFKMFPSSHPMIGGFGTLLTGNNDTWQQAMKGQVDEIRLWKRVLTQTEIGSLYELENAGR
ncbi:LamG-like jellyroll fold domain-containing protein [uncultured Flavobacterium sp.]|uniref:LamG-like jellyroll fold domain-containing protein n=1 Tax=uncultured Flavobacterium sp. TaxID=165435 RepID=UPI0025E0CC5A|nr:LamG-like jellyroll fold domain-containing protein [uncultured Flavobacterium sp.]